MAWARIFALESAGSNSAARIAMIAITTSNSIKVKPLYPLRCNDNRRFMAVFECLATVACLQRFQHPFLQYVGRDRPDRGAAPFADVFVPEFHFEPLLAATTRHHSCPNGHSR